MPFGWTGLLFLVEFAGMFVIALVIARFILIHTVRIIRREWTRTDPPRS